jgi:DNA-binding transcriptional LysR family regulator
MDVSLLRTLREVARHGSITSAAHSLGYTQSAVSRQIATLESSVGARLFDRTARGVTLTEHGRCVLPHAESALRALEAAQHSLEDLDRLDGGRLRVGAFPTANAALIPLAMADFARRHPRVSILLVEGTTRPQLARLDADEVDLAVVSAFPQQTFDTERFDVLALCEDRMLVAFPSEHRLATRERVRLADLEQERWIAGEASDKDRAISPLHLAAHPDTQVNFIVSEWTAKLGLVAAGLGVTLVPSLAIPAIRPDVALVPLHPSHRAARTIYTATSKGRTAPPATQAFRDILSQHAESLAGASRSRSSVSTVIPKATT